MKKGTKFKKVLSFVVFIMIAGILLEKVSWLFRANSRESREDIVGFANEGELDVILCGGSNLSRFYQPLEAWNEKGFTSYNYATSAAKPDLFPMYIADTLKTHKADLYICDIRAIPLLTREIVEKDVRNWSDSISLFSPTRWKGITEYLYIRDVKDADIVSYYFDIAKYHSNRECLGDSYQYQYLNAKNIDNADKGFEPNLEHCIYERPLQYEGTGELTEQQEDVLMNILDFCDKEKLPVLFTVCPYVISEADWLVLNACKEIIESRGYEYVNFNEYYEEIGLDFQMDFSDPDHVNFIGAEKYTKFLMNFLDQKYDLPDHREDNEYKKWNEDYEAYSEWQDKWRQNTIDTIENHFASNEIGENLAGIDDLEEWYASIWDNENFTIFVEKYGLEEQEGTEFVYKNMISDWKIANDSTSYVGVWRGTQELYSKNGNAAVSGGTGTINYSIQAKKNPEMILNDINYVKSEDGIWVAVLNNITQEIVDVVNIVLDVEGKTVLKR